MITGRQKKHSSKINITYLWKDTKTKIFLKVSMPQKSFAKVWLKKPELSSELSQHAISSLTLVAFKITYIT